MHKNYASWSLTTKQEAVWQVFSHKKLHLRGNPDVIPLITYLCSLVLYSETQDIRCLYMYVYHLQNLHAKQLERKPNDLNIQYSLLFK